MDDTTVSLNLLSEHVSDDSIKNVKRTKKKILDKQLEDVTYNCIQNLKHIKKLTCQDEVDYVLSQIECLLTFLPGPITVQKLVLLDDISYKFYVKNCFVIFIEMIIQYFDHSFPFSAGHLYQPVEKLFTIEDAYFFESSFEILLYNLKEKNERSLAIANLLQILLKSEGFLAHNLLFVYNMKLETVLEEDRSKLWNDHLKVIVSLPSRIANVLENNMPTFFCPKNFESFFIYNILKLVEFIACTMKNDPNSVHFIDYHRIALLLSKFVINSHDISNSEAIINFIKVVTHVTNKPSEKCILYKRIFQNILINLERSSIEVIAKQFLLNINPTNYLLKETWGKGLIDNENWKFVLCNKIPLLTYFEKDYLNLLLNLVVYLSCVSEHNLKSLLVNLMHIWADKVSINNTSTEQHIFVSKLILLIINSLQNIGLNESEVCIIKKLVFSGMSVHLECTVDMIRCSGMKTGEIVINFLNKETQGEDQTELKFDYNGFNDKCRNIVDDMQNLFDKDLQDNFKVKTVFDESIDVLLQEFVPKEVKDSEYIPPDRKFRRKTHLEPKNELLMVEPPKQKNTAIKIINSTDFVLDSDDDLEPYDLSNDIKISKKNPPTYLRDLRDSLLETDDHEIFNLCLQNCEKLIVSQLADDDATIGLEILEILISLEPKFYVDNFENLVFQSCVAIVCTYPAVYADYLCKQIHSDLGKYSIARRILMLDILKQAAKVLSNYNQVEQIKSNDFNKGNVNLGISEAIISKRLESKTRYFSNYKYIKKEWLNKFADVAKFFFYPLLYGFNQNKILCQSIKKDGDCILLIHFIESLAVIMCASQNCPIIVTMAKEIFNFSWYLRYHNDVKVRMAVLTLIYCTIINIPKNLLIQCFPNELIEIRLWLADLLNIARGDPNLECRKLAASVMVLVEGILKVDIDVNETS